MKKIAQIVSILLILISFGMAFYFLPLLPERMISHWGPTGEADGYTSKGFGLFFMPILMIIFTVMFWLIPKIDPLKKNVEAFRQYFDGFIIMLELFFLYVYGLTIAFNFGYQFNMTALLMPAFAILFYYVGVMVSKAKRNYFIGIRTPWTLANDKVWDKTHRLGGTLFKWGALLFLISIFLPAYGFFMLIIYIIGISLGLCLYSYLEFRKEEK